MAGLAPDDMGQASGRRSVSRATPLLGCSPSRLLAYSLYYFARKPLEARGRPRSATTETEKPRRAFSPSGAGQLLGFARLCGLAGPQPAGTDPSRTEAIQLNRRPSVHHWLEPKRQPPRGVFADCPLDHLLSRVSRCRKRPRTCQGKSTTGRGVRTGSATTCCVVRGIHGGLLDLTPPKAACYRAATSRAFANNWH